MNPEDLLFLVMPGDPELQLGWYFWNKWGTQEIGPFATEADALKALDNDRQLS